MPDASLLLHPARKKVRFNPRPAVREKNPQSLLVKTTFQLPTNKGPIFPYPKANQFKGSAYPLRGQSPAHLPLALRATSPPLQTHLRPIDHQKTKTTMLERRPLTIAFSYLLQETIKGTFRWPMTTNPTHLRPLRADKKDESPGLCLPPSPHAGTADKPQSLTSAPMDKKPPFFPNHRPALAGNKSVQRRFEASSDEVAGRFSNIG